MNKKVQTDYLFAQPSFASGAARVLDLWGTFDEYNRSATPQEADGKAIAADWLIVGQALCDAVDYQEDQKVA
jgi:hypothetical protein